VSTDEKFTNIKIPYRSRLAQATWATSQETNLIARGQAPKIDPYKIPMSIKLLVLDKAGCRPGARGHGFAIADVAASPPFVGAMRILGPTPNKNKNNKHEARWIYNKPESSASEKKLMT